jgi:tetratricopeptide (TPR) repeat protein
MTLKTIILFLLAAGGVSYFVPTPQEVRDSFTAGQNFYASKDYRKAIDQYNKILATESNLLTADSVRVSLLNGELDAGVRTAAIYQKANAYRNLGRNDSATALFRLVQTRFDTPKLLVLAQYQIYDIFYQQKEYDSVVVAARDLVTRYPFDEKVEQAYYDIGWAFRLKKEYDSSTVAFKYLVDMYKSSPLRVRAMYQIGQNDLDDSNWRNALKSFQTLINEYQLESFAKTEFEKMELRTNKERQIFDAASNRESDNTSLELVSKSEFKIAEAYQRMDMYDSSMQRYRSIIKRYTLLPTLAEISYIKMAELTLQVKGTEAAIAVYKGAIDENFQNKVFQARMQYKVARTYQDKDVFTRAADEYAFYVKAYGEFALQSDFSVENARFFVVLNRNAAMEYEEVIASSDSFLVNHPESEYTPKALLLRGLSFQSLGKLDQARQTYEDLIARFSASTEAYQARTQNAKSYYDEKDYAQAVKYYEALLREDLSKIDVNAANYYLGVCYFALARYDDAIRTLNTVASQSAFYPFAFARLVKTLIAQTKYEEGEKYITDVIERGTKDTASYTAYSHLAHGDLLAAWGKYDKAIDEMSTVLKDSSINENARFQATYARGALYQQTKRFGDAIKELEFCLSQPNFRKNFFGLIAAANEKLALSYVGVGRKKEAVATMSQLLANALTAAEKIRYLSGLTEVYAQLNEFQKVVEYGSQIVAADSADDNSRAKAYATLSNAYGNLNDLAKSTAALFEAAERLPAHPYIRDLIFETAMLHYDSQDFVGAGELFRKYIEKYQTGDKYEDAFYYESECLTHSGKTEEGIASLQKYMIQYPSSSRLADAQYEIAETYYNTNRFEEAAREYARTARLFPKSDFAVSSLYNQGWCYYRMTDTLKMVSAFRQLVDVYPESKEASDAQFSIGDFYYNAQSYDSARIAYQKILDKYPAYARVEEAKELVRELSQITSYREYEAGMRSFDDKDYATAITKLESVVHKYPDADVVSACEVNIASAYEQIGERERALKLFEEIINKYSPVSTAQTIVFFAELHRRWIESGRTE